MPRPFKKNKFRDKLETRLEELADQTEELRREIVERAPGVRDQIVEQAEELRREIVERAPGIRDQLMDALPDKEQLLDLRDDVYDRLPDSVTERLPDKAKPKGSRLKKIAILGAITGAGAAAFATLRRRGTTVSPATPFREPTPTPATSPVPAAEEKVEVVEPPAPEPAPAPAKKAPPAKKSDKSSE
jgi:hypothetical protein